MGKRNPCLTCGACCACFRVSFYYGETDEHTPGGVPVPLTEPLTPFRQVMSGTRHVPPRCVALAGVVGHAVSCSIHPRRPSVCREFAASYLDGLTPHDRCDRARAVYELSPLRPEDWQHHPDDGAPPEPLEPMPLDPAA